MRIGGDSDRLRLMRSDVASQQPDDAWTSRGNLEWPEHPRRRGFRIAERRPGELRESSCSVFSPFACLSAAGVPRTFSLLRL